MQQSNGNPQTPDAGQLGPTKMTQRETEHTLLRLQQLNLFTACLQLGAQKRKRELITGPFKFEVQQHLTELRIPPVVSDNQALFAGGH
ncbi:MAG: hypothetical protein KME03_20725 [Aphanocapsa lilacina HA4352-LM1]|nr:hypothetical protein [Aphanocapsa lilacina HA4352-LM1]